MSPAAYNQINIPSFMYGTAWKKEATTRLVELAVDTGFTAIDTANQLIHYDERLVGEGLLKLKQKGIARESLFLQTKFTPANGQDHRTPYDRAAGLTTQVKQSMDSSLSHLHTDVIDSYVLHGPHSRGKLTAADWEVWSAMEELYKAGKARMIGISNVSVDQLIEFCAKATTKPMVVQNRCFAVTGWDADVRDVCRRESIIYQGFSLLTANPMVMSSSFVRELATKLGATPAQVIFRFSIAIGMLPLTGTTNQTHMKQDLESDQFELSAEDVSQIERLVS